MVALALDEITGSLRTQTTIVRALVRRELHTRYTKSRLGVVLVVVEPLISILSVFGLRVMLGANYHRHGMTLPIILITGFLTHFGLRSVVLSVATMTRRNTPLLMFPRITILDSIISSSIVGWFTYTCVLILLSVAAITLLGTRSPDDYTLILTGFYFSIWAGIMMGIIFGVIERYVHMFQYFVQIVIRLNMYLSGGMWTADEIPGHLHNYIIWNPCLHMVEIMREGWVSTYHSPAASAWYVTAFCVGLTIVALVLERTTRHFKIT